MECCALLPDSRTQGQPSEAVSLSLGSVMVIPDCCRQACAAIALLQGVRKFVSDELAALIGRGQITTGGENDVPAKGIGLRAHGPRRLRRIRIYMHSHLTEVVAEARFHEGAGGLIQRLARRTEHLVDDRRHGTKSGLVCRTSLQALLVALGALPIGAGR